MKYVISHFLFITITINIKDWTFWSVPSPELQLLAPTLLWSSNCSPSLWSVVVWFQRDLVLWHSLRLATTKLTQRGAGYPSWGHPYPTQNLQRKHRTDSQMTTKARKRTMNPGLMKTGVWNVRGLYGLRTKIIINDETLEQVNQFTYLGCSISYQFSNDVEFKLANFLQLIGTIKRAIFEKVRTETILKI